jgi:AraC-like DNA-binding protein
MEKARGLLQMNYSIEHIAMACGYGSLASFPRAFKRLNQVSPFTYCQNIKV